MFIMGLCYGFWVTLAITDLQIFLWSENDRFKISWWNSSLYR